MHQINRIDFGQKIGPEDDAARTGHMILASKSRNNILKC